MELPLSPPAVPREAAAEVATEATEKRSPAVGCEGSPVAAEGV